MTDKDFNYLMKKKYGNDFEYKEPQRPEQELTLEEKLLNSIELLNESIIKLSERVVALEVGTETSGGQEQEEEQGKEQGDGEPNKEKDEGEPEQEQNTNNNKGGE